MTFSEARAAMSQGARVRRGAWTADRPSFLVLIPGREIAVTYAPMTDHVGDGTRMLVADHMDAVFLPRPGTIQDKPLCVVGYWLSADDVSASDWFRV
jgi:hypothetical protein